MAVMARDNWTDERLDRLNAKVDTGFKEMRSEFKAVRAEMHAGSEALRAEIKEEFRGIRGEMGQLRGEMGQLRSEVGAFHRTVIQLVWAMVGTIFLGFMGTIAALFTLV